MEENDKFLLNQKRPRKDIFKVSKSSEEDKIIKRQKISETPAETSKTSKTSKTSNKTEDEQYEIFPSIIEEYLTEEQKELYAEFDKFQEELIEEDLSEFIDFSKYKNEDYTELLYNNLKELKNNDDFKECVTNFLTKGKKENFKAKIYYFIDERKKILENSEKNGIKWYKNYIKTRKKNSEINYKDYLNKFNELSEDEKEEIIIIALLINSFEDIEKEDKKFDVSKNKENPENKKNEIKIGLDNFNLKENYIISFISSIKFKFNNKITEIDLTGNDLTPKACFFIGSFFKYNNKNIKLLNLSRCSLDNKCLNMFVIGTMFYNEDKNKEQINLEKLNLRDNENINDENNSDNEYPLSLIVEKFLIKNLELSNINIGNKGLKKLCETFLKLLNNQEKKFNLENLNLYNIGLQNEESLETLGDFVAHENSTLKILILSKNLITCQKTSSPIAPNYFKILMEKIGESKTLEELLLLKCQIGKNDDDVDILCEMIEKNKSLKSLRLFDNLINDEEDFLKILKLFSEYKNGIKNKSMKSLELSKNFCHIRADEAFLNIIDDLNLEYLDMNQNKIDEKEKEIFRKRTNTLEKIKIIY